MRAAVGPDRALIGELYLPIERLMRYYGAGLDLPSNFHLISTPWEAEALGAHIAAYEAALPPGAWPNFVLGNHDRPRIASRVGAAQARVAAVLLLTLRGTPTLYYGDELGLRDVRRPARARAGPVGAARAGAGSGARPGARADAVVGGAQRRLLPAGRGAVAAPRPGRRQRGRAGGRPGLAAGALPAAVRAARSEEALALGDWRGMRAEDGVLAYVRGERYLVALNLTAEERSLALGELAGEVVLSARGPPAVSRSRGRCGFPGDEALVVRLDPA